MRQLFKAGSYELPVTIKSIKNSKKLRIIIRSNGDLVLTKPPRISNKFALSFLEKKSPWIVAYLEKIKLDPEKLIPGGDRAMFIKNRRAASVFIKNRLDFFSRIHSFKYGRVSIRNQKTRWGSCSRQGNLNFNYRLIFLKPHMADYVIVHELCHLTEFNHSQEFWRLVGSIIPDYRQIRRYLKGFSL